jgi:RNA polymerase-binding protein DksA
MASKKKTLKKRNAAPAKKRGVARGTVAQTMKQKKTAAVAALKKAVKTSAAAPPRRAKPAPRPTPRPITPELRELRGRLQHMLNQRREDIVQGVRGAGERDLAHIQDTSDMASDAADGDLALRIAESETVEAGEIERAIEKIDNGTYGYCEICTKAINAERLLFLPYVTMCVRCQELAEIRKRERPEELEDLATEGGEPDSENN